MAETLEKTALNYQTLGKLALENWQVAINQNIYTTDKAFQHLVHFFVSKNSHRKELEKDLIAFGEMVVNVLEPLVAENNQIENLPRMQYFDALGQRIDKVSHHPSYVLAGNIIYQTRLLERMVQPGGMLTCLLFLFLSSQTGEAGHNCPIACSAGIIRVLQRITNVPQQHFFLEKLLKPSFVDNYTGAQFLTEIQGGSDVGLNAVYAKQQDNQWRIYGDKWFCSNANADLMFVMARYDLDQIGTKGLALFLVPTLIENRKNNFTINRLKDKLGTRSMATGEISFQGSIAYQLGELASSFHLAMDQVLHTSRLFNSVCVLAMARRSFSIAYHYARERIAFGQPILHYPLVQENLARIRAENMAMVAGIFATAALQDECDASDSKHNDEKRNDATGTQSQKLLLRTLVNMQKYFTAKHSVEHIHHALDVLAGNGTIETFSAIPRLLRDCIICENWEGTHNIICAQTLKDISKYRVDELYFAYVDGEIAKFKTQDEAVEELKRFTQNLKSIMLDFKQQSQALQSLIIKDVIDEMVTLFCAIHLLKEGLDQKNNGDELKLTCYELFSLYHLKKQVKKDNAFLNLLHKTLQ